MIWDLISQSRVRESRIEYRGLCICGQDPGLADLKSEIVDGDQVSFAAKSSASVICVKERRGECGRHLALSSSSNGRFCNDTSAYGFYAFSFQAHFPLGTQIMVRQSIRQLERWVRGERQHISNSSESSSTGPGTVKFVFAGSCETREYEMASLHVASLSSKARKAGDFTRNCVAYRRHAKEVGGRVYTKVLTQIGQDVSNLAVKKESDASSCNPG
ncbi:unnamed protein product [Protopolystoma xenopodis]|uniref:Uncharacterized protein n=1 Tax=Protopolystoma xenopodis TaxID=117903 RepID=A0A3S5A6X7_9PLAT|nr:unnamed protein product [Protopolystoma xenopodis]